MKRKFFYFAVCALALSACTSEDVVEDVAKSRNAIGFVNVVNKPTRAEDITGDNLNQFNVFGFYVNPTDPFSAYEIFDDVLVKRNGVNWSYEESLGELRYWLNGNKYYFYAYNCGNAEKLSTEYGTFSLDMDNKKQLSAKERVLIINNYRCDYMHQHDLIYASNVGGNDYECLESLETGNAEVALQFKHILSKVNARFTSKFPSEYTVYIKNVAIQNIRNFGNYHPVTQWQGVVRVGEMPYINLSTATTDEEGNSTNISVVNGLDEKGRQLKADTGTGFVIPWGYQGDNPDADGDNKVYLTFNIEVRNQGKVVLTKSLRAILNPTWEPGYFYTYNVELSGSSTNMDAIIF
ncbi:MAG: fimbrillin family protein, partial [Muribaculaceae bacterium]|nr:fimbrillin family protein [Muribaculaceae bacterium]